MTGVAVLKLVPVRLSLNIKCYLAPSQHGQLNIEHPTVKS